MIRLSSVIDTFEADFLAQYQNPFSARPTPRPDRNAGLPHHTQQALAGCMRGV